MIQRLAAVPVLLFLAACATTNAVGNDATATVKQGPDAQKTAQIWCKAYGKVPQLRESDAARATASYDCVVAREAKHAESLRIARMPSLLAWKYNGLSTIPPCDRQEILH